jgi:hypothetical protein
MVRAAVLAAAAVVGASAAVAAAALPAGSGSRQVGTATALCTARSFTVAFDPKRRVVVTDGVHRLASATFTSRLISGRCRRVAGPRRYLDGGLGSQIRARTSFRCLATRPIRIHVNPIRNDAGAIVGSSLQVGIGSASRLRVIASAILKNKGNPYASRVHRAATYCKLGA